MPTDAYRLAAMAVVVALAAGCGHDHDHDHDHHRDTVDCRKETRADVYVAGLEKVGSAVKVQLLDSSPAPPAKGNNRWQIKVLDQHDAGVAGLNIAVEPFMPDHVHGTPIVATVTAGANPGEYIVDPVNLSMPGLWEIRIDISDGQSINERIIYNFCIDG